MRSNDRHIMLNRRDLGTRVLRSVLTLTLLRWAARADAIGGTLKSSTRPWLSKLEGACAAVSSAQLSPVDWQREIEATLGRVELPDFLRAIDFEALAARAKFPPKGEGLTRIYFLDDDGHAQPFHFTAYLFALKKDVSVVPHGHHNMVTMHMMLAGKAHARHFDRVHDSATHLVIRPTSDSIIEPGQVTTISDDRDNIHWFRALTQPVFMFNIGVYRVNGKLPSGDRDYVDPLGGSHLGNGLIRAPRLDRDAAYAKYGHA
jgi:hypothetical protein